MLSFAFTHVDRGVDGAVDVVVAPNGSVQTADASSAEMTLREAQQFVATIFPRNTGDFFERPE